MPDDKSSFSNHIQFGTLSDVQNLKVFPQRFEVIQAIRIISHAQPSFVGGRNSFQIQANQQLPTLLKEPTSLTSAIKFKWSLKMSQAIHYVEQAAYKDCWEVRLNYLNVLTIHGPMVTPSSMYHLNAKVKRTTENFLSIFATNLFDTYYKIACKYWVGLDDLLPHNSRWGKIAGALLSYLNHPPSPKSTTYNPSQFGEEDLSDSLKHALIRDFYPLSAMLGLTLKKRYSTWDIYQVFAQQYQLKIHIKELTGKYYQISQSLRMRLVPSQYDSTERQTSLRVNRPGSAILGSCVLGDKTWIQDDALSFTVESSSHSFVKEFWRNSLYYGRFSSLLRYLIPSQINYRLHAKCSTKEKSYLGKNKTALAKNKLIHPSEKANDKTTGHTLGGNFFLT